MPPFGYMFCPMGCPMCGYGGSMMGFEWMLWPVFAALKLTVGLAVLGLIAYVVLRLLGLRPADVVRELKRDYRDLKTELKRG
ncbi:hypothetical protein [Methanopyrus sp. SNP6]|uniref:hypothetical protein n=1 Tax=Methanopyrus sp. SNP6 TaxID=1937005 RepID=UPI0011E58C96|nr:hypothetical protein [Methanopyrus sp. SNP6]